MHWGEQFVAAKGWDAATRILMLAGRDLNPLSPELHTSKWAISGCESPVWLKPSLRASDKQANQVIVFAAYSPGKIVRGLVNLLLEPVQEIPVEVFQQFDFESHVETLKLNTLLSPSRNNGAASVMHKLQYYQSHSDSLDFASIH